MRRCKWKAKLHSGRVKPRQPMNERDMARLRTMCKSLLLGEVQVLQRMVRKRVRRLVNGAIGAMDFGMRALQRARPMGPRHGWSGRLWGWHNGSYLRDEYAVQHDGFCKDRGCKRTRQDTSTITSCWLVGLDGRLSREYAEDVSLGKSVHVECQTRGISRSFTRIGSLYLRRLIRLFAGSHARPIPALQAAFRRGRVPGGEIQPSLHTAVARLIVPRLPLGMMQTE
ncbi:hypothetical protein BBK36DRAFT_1175363 [Trichoderma citrinoviride]|uniref:Uncharacterized protein n=1 Tax=Trichoderma citrinoviride TaxID=58853 RepID=A0A2T4BN46_9HYPO|nr:hypothetical protein BBK36DRAFT_1175363 [Trichoderma citrinoviride]PTB70745.1 hypothetical protein BBK36DRAFT_1175363 [Trichoderma citrinoviride]